MGVSLELPLRGSTSDRRRLASRVPEGKSIRAWSDPAPTLRTLHIPILALIGEKDLQVPPDQNIPALRAALASDPKATVAELPGLNHLFQMAVTGGVGEYGEIAETMAPSVLARVTDWILAATKST